MKSFVVSFSFVIVSLFLRVGGFSFDIGREAAARPPLTREVSRYI